MKCVTCNCEMEGTSPMSSTTIVDNVEVGLALTMHWSLNKINGNREVKDVIPISAEVCPKCGRVELYLNDKSLSTFMKYKIR